MRTTRIVLFCLLGATVAGTIALAIYSNVTRGPAVTFDLVPSGHATAAQLDADGAAMVRRLQSLGYTTAGAKVSDNSVLVTMYGSAPKLRTALEGALPAAQLRVRPAQCAAPPFGGSGVESQVASTPLQCGSGYLLTAAALRVDVSTGAPTRTVPADPRLASRASTSELQDLPDDTVLLPTGSASGFAGGRLVAGPARLTNADVVSASASHRSGQWTLDIDLTSAGSTRYDALCRRQFHAYVAVDIDGSVVSAPLIEPTSSTFHSLGGTLEIAADFTESEVLALADDLTSPLPAPLELAK